MLLSTRYAVESDIPLIRDLAERSWFHTYMPILSEGQVNYMFQRIYSLEALTNQMLEDGHAFLIVYNGETAMGFASFSEIENGKYKLHKLYLVPEAQGSGLGKFLLLAVQGEVKDAGASVLCLNVNRYNKALDFYTKMGFSIVETVDIPFGEYWLNDHVMEKSI